MSSTRQLPTRQNSSSARQLPTRQNSSSTRQLPTRQNSFKMPDSLLPSFNVMHDSLQKLPSFTTSMVRDSLQKFPSFNTKRTQSKPASNHQEDEMNVFASDIVSKEYLLGELKEVRHNQAIVKLEIEDLLVSNNHSSFLPVVKAILLSDERAWEYLRFVDTISPSDILWWQGMKHILMREYETTIDEESKYVECVSFQASIQVSEGATKKSIQSLLKSIQNDEDVQSVAFAGSLYGKSHDSVPDKLANLFDATSCLTESFVMNVKCGWQSHGDHETCCCKVLKACQRVLRGEDLHATKLEAKLDGGRRRPRRHLSTDSGLSLASSNGASVHSTRSDGRRRKARLSATSDCPIVEQGDHKRSITLPAPAGNSSHAPSKRAVPLKSSSFVIKRPTSTSLLDMDNRADKSSTLMARSSSSRLSRRTKSFQQGRPGVEIADNKNYRWSSRETGTKDAAVVDKAAAAPRKPIRDDSSSSHEAPVPSKPKHRRIKSLDRMALEHTENGKKESVPVPDYDWSKGNYVIPSAA